MQALRVHETQNMGQRAKTFVNKWFLFLILDPLMCIIAVFLLFKTLSSRSGAACCCTLWNPGHDLLAINWIKYLRMKDLKLAQWEVTSNGAVRHRCKTDLSDPRMNINCILHDETI